MRVDDLRRHVATPDCSGGFVTGLPHLLSPTGLIALLSGQRSVVHEALETSIRVAPTFAHLGHPGVLAGMPLDLEQGEPLVK